ncbi:methyltransferase domain-containing protein [Tenggerimyces flavus]|uniref:Methyltransferase domain-containing protein n=1 Tax=Tenggerimyces flavus TaxID=1708749 RepID=A0ABV7YMW4_9ACTN|nr:methyltransferase domain-containing protein [Tenggerimyces flavus]MBM7784898.1 ubiquinone/menaquinone biosynthesis C-methylase UbiE [Tenggerimyces flavus]
MPTHPMTADPGYMDAARAEPFFINLKQHILDQLDLAPGMHVLDLGCGTGEDVAAMAEQVQPTGVAMGLDRSTDMIGLATRRFASRYPNVVLHMGDAHRLPYADGSISACRTERTLQHVTDPAQVVAEVRRVLRPGGLFVAAEPDWGTSLVTPDWNYLARRVLDHWTTFNQNPTVGRTLPALLRQSGFDVRDVEGRTVVYRTFNDANRRFPLQRAVTNAAAHGSITHREADAWLGKLRHADQIGTFMFAVTIFIVTARHAR